MYPLDNSLKCDFSLSSMTFLPGIYKLQIDNISKFVEQLELENDNSIIANIFRHAFSPEKIKSQIRLIAQPFINEVQIRIYEIKDCYPDQTAVIEFLERHIMASSAETEATIVRYDQMLAVNQGFDIKQIKLIVHRILGVCANSTDMPNDQDGFSIDHRQHYLKMMISSGLIETAYSTIADIIYQPGEVAKSLLLANPHIVTLLIGCGKGIHWQGGICTKRETTSHQHDDNVLSIDISMALDPHIVANVYDYTLWEQVPDERLNLIADHSNMELFGDEKVAEIIPHFFRTLRSGGKIDCQGCLRNREIANLYISHGFAISECGRFALKP